MGLSISMTQDPKYIFFKLKNLTPLTLTLTISIILSEILLSGL